MLRTCRSPLKSTVSHADLKAVEAAAKSPAAKKSTGRIVPIIPTENKVRFQGPVHKKTRVEA
jgi:hypothetical protein